MIRHKNIKTKSLLSVLLLIISLSLFSCDENKSKKDDLYRGNQAYLVYDISDAEMYYKRYLRKNPYAESRWWVWSRLLDIAINIRQQKDIAAGYLEVMQEEYEDDQDRSRSIKISLATVYNELQRYDRAVAIWEELVNTPGTPDEDKARIYRDLASIYLRRLEFTESTTALHACLKLEVNDDEKSKCLYDLAETQIILGELPQAETNLQNLLKMPVTDSQRNLIAQFMLADVLEQQGHYEEALLKFKEMRELHPNHTVMELRIESLEKRMKKR